MMKMKSSSAFYFAVCALIFAFCFNSVVCEENKDVYIVYMGSLPENDDRYSPLSHHVSILQDVLGDGFRQDLLVRTYGRSFNGFAAWLSEEERDRMAGIHLSTLEKILYALEKFDLKNLNSMYTAREDIISIFTRQRLTLQTTRSWDFMGVPLLVKRRPAIESDMIIGMIDSGITPDSASFSDKGFGPIPKKWKGSCDANFTCNNKIIGARGYSFGSPLDRQGHGTHTASTAAGNTVAGASFYEIAGGIARGGVPSARIAVYKACYAFCSSEDLLKSFDDAIADGVDIISISIGGAPVQFDRDVIAIGSFHAMQKNVLTVNSAGNEGPLESSTGSTSPWMLSVAASTTDRDIKDKIVLGNGKSFYGNSINGFTVNETNYPIIYGKNVTTTCDEDAAMMCQDFCLDKKLVKDKIVVCALASGAVEAARAGAAAAIYTSNTPGEISYVEALPAANLNKDAFKEVTDYVTSTKNPYGYITKSITVKDKSAPTLSWYSSRGPNLVVEEILKPDISAPGTTILAAYSPLEPPSSVSYDTRQVKYNILSGTSMAAPHAAGAAAYIKTFHPDWSASAIKSALMTTASRLNDGAHEADYGDGEFAYGSGFMNPVKAVKAGLVYETSMEGYLELLCSMNVTSFGKCPRAAIGASQRDLNYPSMNALVEINKPFTVSFRRTVKNVGKANSKYVAEVEAAGGVKVVVRPKALSFKALEQEQSFVVTVTGPPLESLKRASASLVWSDGRHRVRSPIVVYTK